MLGRKTVGPTLPPELERIVFELAARAATPTQVYFLLFVAARVKIWVEPYLYRVLYIAKPIAVPQQHRHPFPIARIMPHQRRNRHGFTPVPLEVLRRLVETHHFAACKTVEHAFFDNVFRLEGSDIISEFFSLCPNIVSLSLPGSPLAFLGETFPASDNLHHLSANLLTLLPLKKQRINFKHPIFRNLTHLEVLGDTIPFVPTPPYQNIYRIPRLTHIAFQSSVLANMLSAQITKMAQLECIVVLHLDDRTHKIASDLETDERFVIVEQASNTVDLWIDAVTHPSGYWGRAEAFIAAKRAGKIDRRIHDLRAFINSLIETVGNIYHSSVTNPDFEKLKHPNEDFYN
ncbi:hypothetical protein R3P38DRAFT_2804037 [Favolaschia claudopus]|uniref:Uncharacterized protein n=1 Tax=Favolaschia claudopus TaxID=2862362 RepID=A0AAV9ZQK1_9AGAR